jgi:competence protein ComEA
MDLIKMKEKIDRLKFFIDKIKYKRERHFYFTIIFLVFLIIIIFSAVFIYLRRDIERKENILKSYYSEIESDDYSERNLENNSSLENGSNSEDNVNYENVNEINLGDSSCFSNSSYENLIKVYICGSVKDPDVYEMEDGERVVDLLEKAGGPTDEACLDVINLAQILIDGQRIYIPSNEEITSGNTLFFSSNDYLDNNSLEAVVININHATCQELKSLPGIGEVTAKNIIDYREKYGLFTKEEDLKNVKGIGEKKYETIKDMITI